MQAPNNTYFDPYSQVKCPVCGGTDFEWGRLGAQTMYLPTSSLWNVRGRQLIKTRRCRECNNLLIFTDPDKTRQQNMIAVVIVIFAILVMVAIFLLLLFRVAR